MVTRVYNMILSFLILGLMILVITYGINPKKIMFDWICVVCYSMGKYDMLFMDACMLIHGLEECRKSHGESICSDVLMCGVLYGVMCIKYILRFCHGPYHNKICVMGWVVDFCYNVKKRKRF